MNLQKQLRCVYLHAFTSTLHFTDAVWVALLAARGFSLGQIGLAEGVFHGVSLLCEVPSGMAADLLGRRRTLIFGGALGVVSAVTMAFAPSLAFICAGMGLKALGYNLLSGTTEALTYDSLKQCGKTDAAHAAHQRAFLCVDTNKIQVIISVRSEDCFYFIAFVLSQKTVVYEYTGQLIADCFG